MTTIRWSRERLAALPLEQPIIYTLEEISKLPANYEVYVRGPKHDKRFNRLMTAANIFKEYSMWAALCHEYSISFNQPVFSTEGVMLYKQSKWTLIEGCYGHLSGLLIHNQLSYRAILHSIEEKRIYDISFLQHFEAKCGNNGSYLALRSFLTDEAACFARFRSLTQCLMSTIYILTPRSLIEIMVDGINIFVVDGKDMTWSLNSNHILERKNFSMTAEDTLYPELVEWCPILSESWKSDPNIQPRRDIVCRPSYPLLSHLMTETFSIPTPV